MSQQRVVLSLALLAIILIAATPQAYGGKYEPLKQRLFQRYDQKQVSIVHDKI